MFTIAESLNARGISSNKVALNHIVESAAVQFDTAIFAANDNVVQNLIIIASILNMNTAARVSKIG